jgi:hypothetical protein
LPIENTAQQQPHAANKHFPLMTMDSTASPDAPYFGSATTIVAASVPAPASHLQSDGTQPEAKRMKRSELLSTSSKTTSKSLAETASADADDDENSFGLKDDAIKWIQQEMVPYGDEAYLLPINHYRPLVLSKDGIKFRPLNFKLPLQSTNGEAKRRWIELLNLF